MRLSTEETGEERRTSGPRFSWLLLAQFCVLFFLHRRPRSRIPLSSTLRKAKDRFQNRVQKAQANAREAIADVFTSSANARAQRRGKGPLAPDAPTRKTLSARTDRAGSSSKNHVIMRQIMQDRAVVSADVPPPRLHGGCGTGHALRVLRTDDARRRLRTDDALRRLRTDDAPRRLRHGLPRGSRQPIQPCGRAASRTLCSSLLTALSARCHFLGSRIGARPGPAPGARAHLARHLHAPIGRGPGPRFIRTGFPTTPAAYVGVVENPHQKAASLALRSTNHPRHPPFVAPASSSGLAFRFWRRSGPKLRIKAPKAVCGHSSGRRRSQRRSPQRGSRDLRRPRRDRPGSPTANFTAFGARSPRPGPDPLPLLPAKRRDDLPIEQLRRGRAARTELVESFAGDRRDPGTICKERPTSSSWPAPQRARIARPHERRGSIVNATDQRPRARPARRCQGAPCATHPDS